MKLKISLRAEFLLSVIVTVLMISIFVGGISIYELDKIVQNNSKQIIENAAKKEAAQINDMFGYMEKSTNIMKNFILEQISEESDIQNEEMLENARTLFLNIVQNAEGAVSCCLRFDPELAGPQAGFVYSIAKNNTQFEECEPTDLSLYSKEDEKVKWYWETAQKGRGVWGMPYYSNQVGEKVISYCTPLIYNNETIGVVGMEFEYKLLTDRIDNIKIDNEGFAYLIKEDTIAYHKTLEQGEKSPYMSEKYLQEVQYIDNGMLLVVAVDRDNIREVRYDISLKIVYAVAAMTLVFIFIVVVMVRKIVKPFESLVKSTVALSNGDYNVKIEQSNTKEISHLSNAFEKMAVRLKEIDRHKNFVAYHDSLTGLNNAAAYKAWEERANEEIKTSDAEIGFVMLDINGLKNVNDIFGHEIGNKLIVAAAQIILGTFKRSDVFRIGGDEFAVILKNRDYNEWEELIERLDRKCEKETITADGNKIPVVLARGIAFYNKETDNSFIDVFNRADDAMYDHKRKTKNEMLNV